MALIDDLAAAVQALRTRVDALETRVAAVVDAGRALADRVDAGDLDRDDLRKLALRFRAVAEIDQRNVKRLKRAMRRR